jgi:undecaprenyl pyrophosphate synthase
MDSMAFDVVRKIGDEIENYATHEWFPVSLSYSYDGYNEIITFMGNLLWSSVDDERLIDDITGDYEELEDFVRRQIKEAVTIIRKVKV